MVLVGGSDEQIPVGEDYRKRRESLQVVLGVKKICPSCIAAGLQPIRVWTCTLIIPSRDLVLY
jgi:hypothetical protein